jgi:hypothetical protein
LIGLNKYYFLVAVIAIAIAFISSGTAQPTAQLLRTNTYALADTIVLDTLTIVPNSIVVKNCNSQDFILHNSTSSIVFINKPNADSIVITYRVFQNNFSAIFKNKSLDLISSSIGENNYYTNAQANANYNNSFVDQGNMDYSGSLSRAITFGNSQDLSLNSQFNLQLNGMLADSIQLQASLTDNTIPFQPDGTTQNLQEFDRISIELKKRNAVLTLGDYDMLRPQSHFMNYYKRVQGLKFTNKMQIAKNWKYNYNVGASLAKGKYVRAPLVVTEGNQGPYKIQGPNGEIYFTILANTEKITIDGVLLTRGENNDYIIDYNIGEITFMPNKMITKDSRVIVEYEFNDRNYINSLLYASSEWQAKNASRFYVNVYTNQDAKNQSLLQTLTPANKQFLSTIGDNFQQAFYSSARQDTFSNDRIMYARVDTIVNGINYDSIYVYSVNADSAKYVVGFTFVGQGNGNYIQSVNIANGRVYAWQAPIGGILQGSFEPYLLLVTPKRQQMVTAGFAMPIGKNKSLNYEIALSNNDPNLFSSLGGSHLGLAHKVGYGHKIPFGKSKKNIFSATANLEYVQAKFRSLENYRNAEFARDWNVAFVPKPANEYIASADLRASKTGSYEIFYGFSNFNRANNYNGLRHTAGGNAQWKQWNFRTINSITTNADTAIQAQFARPEFELTRTFKKFGDAIYCGK